MNNVFKSISQTANNALVAAACNGRRKWTLGIAYLLAVFVLGLVIILCRPDMGLFGLAALTTAMGAGLFSVIWGHVQEGKNGGNGSTTAPPPTP